MIDPIGNIVYTKNCINFSLKETVYEKKKSGSGCGS